MQLRIFSNTKPPFSVGFRISQDKKYKSIATALLKSLKDDFTFSSFTNITFNYSDNCYFNILILWTCAKFFFTFERKNVDAQLSSQCKHNFKSKIIINFTQKLILNFFQIPYLTNSIPFPCFCYSPPRESFFTVLTCW